MSSTSFIYNLNNKINLSKIDTFGSKIMLKRAIEFTFIIRISEDYQLIRNSRKSPTNIKDLNVLSDNLILIWYPL